jgi:hypothetical protein
LTKRSPPPDPRSLIKDVRDWYSAVEPFLRRDPETGRVTGHIQDFNELDNLYPQAAAQALFETEFHGGGEGRLWFWRLWSWRVLDRAGLPAEQDQGERRTERQTGSIRSVSVEGDTPVSRLSRVLDRVPIGTPEHYAALIEYHWRLLDSETGPGEEHSLYRFLRAERAARLSEPPMPVRDYSDLAPDLQVGPEHRLRGAISAATRVGEVVGALLHQVNREMLLPAASLGTAMARGQARGRKTRSEQSSTRVRAWVQEVDSRKPGSEQSAILRIANRLGKKPDAIKKAIQRYRSSVGRDEMRGR